MAQYSPKSDSTFQKKSLAPFVVSTTSVDQNVFHEVNENDAWFGTRNRWYEMTERVRRGGIRPSIQQQYHLDLLYTEIMELAGLEDDWNAESAPAINQQCLNRAHFFVGRLAYAEYDLANGRNMPSVSPTVDGGVQLYWNIDDRQLALTFRPNGSGIEYLLKKQGEAAQRRSLMVDDAIAKVLQTMRDA